MTDRLGFSLAQLMYFVVSADLGNISEAADELRVSQSTISSAVMRLERQLGVQLLHRHHARGVSLTASGRHLLREARTLLGLARDLKAQGHALAGDAAGPLDVGFFFTIAPFLLPLVLRTTRERYGALGLNVHEGTADQLVEFLRDGRCELVVTYGHLTGDARFHPLVDLPPYAVLADDDPLGGAGAVPLAELATRPLVVMDIPAVFRHLDKLFADAGVPMPRLVTTTSVETMRGLVAAGVGFSLMYQRASNTTTLDGGRLRAVQIADELPTSSIGVATMPDQVISGRGRAFLDVLRSALAAGRGVGSAA